MKENRMRTLIKVQMELDGASVGQVDLGGLVPSPGDVLELPSGRVQVTGIRYKCSATSEVEGISTLSAIVVTAVRDWDTSDFKCFQR